MYKYLGLILAILAVNNIITVTPGLPMAAYYAVFGVVFVLGIIAEQPRFDGVITLFVLAIIFSLVGNTIPDYFKAEQRFVSFLLIFCLLSPWFFNNSLSEIRRYIFKYTNLLLIAVVVLSFLGNVTGAFSGIGRSDMFQGLTSHSMLLGPIASIVMLMAVWKGSQDQVKRKVLLVCIAIVLICLYTLLLSGSRGSLIGGMLSAIVLLVLAFRRSFSKLIKLGVFLVLLLAATVPYWSVYTANIDKKNEYAQEEGDNFASRSELWGYRYEEFQQSPVIGIGFASANKGEINTVNGRIEPGTSWGVLFAQLGILGAIPLIILFISYFKKLYQREDYLNKGKLLFALLFFFTIHMVVEGYILGSGSFMFFYIWLLLGVIKNRIKEKEITIY
ncbi:O-antigen ligase [Psychroserpens sp. SPM9]|uniref:O-antigen ligase family protein n=1 Tax=Psychroserpens sp. SPM9 TaxID=2975598 RepID=UPI0021A86841|nr:O-antigen ligase family protein [Psychroserpens sp. SPM9]MDG5490132.1 O-antigen ligase family protein [Psychroserpens sp. SPM9]